MCIIVGQSGAGKTTLLNILGGMDVLTSGKAILNGRNISALRGGTVAGFVYIPEEGFSFQAFAFIVDLIMRKKLNRISMAESLKSIE